jgi:hypothetical protein
MRHLVRNVAVGDEWYGPAHGNARHVPEAVAAQITNPAAWSTDDEPEDVAPAEDEATQLARMSRGDLRALAEARQVDVPARATRDELLAALAPAPAD